MATITPVQASTAGAGVTYVAASGGGDTVATGGYSNVKFMVRNASAASITVTFTGVVQCSQGGTHNVVVTCPVGDTEITIPGQAVGTNGNAAVAYSSAASVTVAAIAG